MRSANCPIPKVRRRITPVAVKRRRLRRLMQTCGVTSEQLALNAQVHPDKVRKWQQRGHIPIQILEYLEYFYS